MTLGFCLRPLFTYNVLYTSSMVEIYLSVCSFWSAFFVGVRVFFCLFDLVTSPSRHLFILILLFDVWNYVCALNKASNIRWKKANWLFRKKAVSLDSFPIAQILFCVRFFLSFHFTNCFVCRNFFHQRISNIYSQFEDSKREEKHFEFALFYR